MYATNSYEEYLSRGIKKLPSIKGDDARFVIPIPKVFTEGRTTVLDNFTEIVSTLNRDSDHVLKYLLRELGTAGKIDGGRVVFQGRFSNDVIASLINEYVEEFVICSECNRPDTHLTKSDRTLMLKCDACGLYTNKETTCEKGSCKEFARRRRNLRSSHRSRWKTRRWHSKNRKIFIICSGHAKRRRC